LGVRDEGNREQRGEKQFFHGEIPIFELSTIGTMRSGAATEDPRTCMRPTLLRQPAVL
jgi:hypothetical protein